MPADAGLIAAGVADEHETVRRDRRHGHRHTRHPHVDLVIPQRVAVVRVERQHVRVRGAAEQPPVEIREAAMHAERGRVLHGPFDIPFLGAGGRVDCVRARLGREVHRAGDDDRARLQRGDFRQRVAAHRRELRDVAAIDLVERREAIARERAVVGGPIPGRHRLLCCARRWRRRRGGRSRARAAVARGQKHGSQRNENRQPVTHRGPPNLPPAS